jgi:hypothetical protein
MRLTCPHCSQPLDVPAEFGGKNLTCPTCQTMFGVPALDAATPCATARASDHFSSGLSNKAVVCLSAVVALLLALVLGLWLWSPTKPETSASQTSSSKQNRGAVGSSATAAHFRIEWQQTFGGSGHDEFSSIQAVPGGGYLLAGSSSSPISGNKSSASFGSNDWWIVRVDDKGNKIWEKSFGGSGSDLLKRVQPLLAGGVLLYGFTESPADGNKTSAQFGKGDGWMIRIDPNGEKLWEKAFGGSDWDNINDVRETSNGDLIVAARSTSTISGNKSSPNYGSHDGVLLRLDSRGERKWEHSFGGPGTDGFECVRELPNGDFIVAGFSGSQTPGGNMTARPATGFDQWAMRVDRNGSKIWERILGGEKAEGLFDMSVANSGLVLLAGGSSSPPGAEKSGPAYGDLDVWLVQLDGNGAKLWDQTYGGLDFDGRPKIVPDADGYIIACSSKSGTSGHKTSVSFGKFDFWLLGISENGTKRWEQSFGGSDDDELFSVHATRDGGFLVSGASASPTDGIKTAPSFGAKDAWVIKLVPDKDH